MSEIPIIQFENQREPFGFDILALQRIWAMDDSRTLGHDPFSFHRLDFFAIMIVVGDKGKHYVDFKEYPIARGDVLLITKGQVHHFDPERSAEAFLIPFSEEIVFKYMSKDMTVLASNLYNHHLYPSVCPMPIELSSSLIAELQAEKNQDDNPIRRNLIVGLISNYLLRLARALGSKVHWKGESAQVKLFIAFSNLLSTSGFESRSARFYADQLDTTYKQLNACCKAVVNKTAKEFVDDTVLLEIKRKLSDKSLSVKEICFSTGFDEPTNFLKFFKRMSGMSPKQFRQAV